jgi:hypothetical protein
VGLFDILGPLATIGGVVAAPFTGGASIPIGSAIGGALSSAGQQGKANEITDEMRAAARADMAARQPFRDQLTQSLQNPAQRQDLSSLFAGSQNPFAQNLGPLNPTTPQMAGPIAPSVRGRGGGGSGRFLREGDDRSMAPFDERRA